MGLSRECIKALALMIETGHIHTPEEVAGEAFGGEPKMTAVAKARRKAGMESLTKLIEAKDGPGIVKHLTDLVRDLSEEGLARQAAIVTGFLMEMQQLFREDHSSMIAYLKMYLRKHKGKAFPVKLDFSVYAQAVATSAGKGGLSEDQKEAIKAGKQATSKIESLTSQLASLKTTVAELKKAKGKSTKTCNFCGVEGHFADRCKANPKSDNYDAEFAKKWKASKKGEAEDDE